MWEQKVAHVFTGNDSAVSVHDRQIRLEPLVDDLVPGDRDHGQHGVDDAACCWCC